MFCILALIVCLGEAVSAMSPSMLIVIRSQPNSYHIKKAESLKTSLESQIEALSADVKIIMAHEEWPLYHDKVWALLPVMPRIAKYKARDWVMFIEDSTIVNIEKVLMVLSRYKPTEDLFLSRGLFDNDMVIIHHFSRRRSKNGGPFLFPDFETGWVLSATILRKIATEWSSSEHKPDFQIDLKHEVAVHLKENFDVELTHLSEFCGAGEESSSCATNVVKDLPVCDENLTVDDIFVGVKTTLMFHKDRVKVVMDTWGPKVKHMILYSNVTDPSIPTVDCGVENTARGHCGKTDAMMKDFLKQAEKKEYKWFVIADDDTIMSVARLVKFLSCYDPQESVFMGEKYGYALNSGHGYGYITGGGGMIFSKPAVEKWVSSCRCPSIDSPDDMLLGNCLLSQGVNTIHSPLFHQARPEDYADGYLSNQTPISFHKHWMVDPIEVYKTWFQEDDSKLVNFQHVHKITITTTPSPSIPTPLPPTPLENPPKDEL